MRYFWQTVVSTLLLTLPLGADMLRLEAGTGIWNAEPTGSLRYGEKGDWISAEDQLGYDTTNLLYFWMDLKHPVPVWPNVRMEITEVAFEGRTEGNVAWGSWWTYTDNAWSETESNEFDLLLYYNLLDDTFWMSLDIGFDVKYIDARYLIRDDYGIGATYEEQDYFIIPQGYLRTRVEIPMTDLGLEADIKYIGNGNSEVYDARLKIDYTFGMLPFGRPAIEAGYRMQRIRIDEPDYETKIDIDAEGVYAGVMLRF